MTNAEINHGMNSPVDSVPYLKAYLHLERQHSRGLALWNTVLCKEVAKQMDANRRKNHILRGLREGRIRLKHEVDRRGDLCSAYERNLVQLHADLACVKAELASWDSEVGAAMPPDFKDYHENAAEERPRVTRAVIESLRNERDTLLTHCQDLATDDAVSRILLEDAKKELAAQLQAKQHDT